MNTTSAEVARRIRSTAHRWLWSTPQRRWTTIGLTAGLALIFFIPAMGLAVGGTAYSIWAWVAAGVVALSTYVGNRFGAMLGRKPAAGKASGIVRP